MITADDIKKTKAFGNIAGSVAQAVVLQKSNREKICNGVNVVKNIGFDAWVKIASPDGRLKTIVQELSTN